MAYQTISNREAGVKEKLGKRTDIDARIITWLRDAYLELGMAYPFDELLSSATTSTVAGTDEYNYPTGVRAIRRLSIIDNNQSILLDRKSIGYIDDFSTIAESRPSYYATWVTQGADEITRFVKLRTIPDKVYTLKWRTWLSPTINGTVENTKLQMPLDWLEILDYAAAMRGFGDLLEHDRANALRDMLYGFIDQTTNRRQPGLIASRMTTMQAEYAAGSFPIGEMSRKYGHG